MSHEETTHCVTGPEVAALMNAISRTLVLHTTATLPAETVVQLAAVALTCHAVLNCGETIRPVIIGQVMAAQPVDGMDAQHIPAATGRPQ